jgi:hypothetical protein
MTNSTQKWFVWATWCLAIVVGGCGGPTAVPTSYSTFSDGQNIFKIQYPAGWSCRSGGNGTFSQASFSSGNAQIDVEADVATHALLSEIAVSGTVPVTTGDPNATITAQRAHWLEKTKFEDQHKEEKAVTALTKLGNGVKSEFTGTSSFGGNIHGYRATTMNEDKRIRVICQCPEDEWQSLKPVFDQVILSVSENP